MSIALGADKGLAYLHSPEANVIHRDFKTSNILIDSVRRKKIMFKCQRFSHLYLFCPYKIFIND